jgi:hypothetical protein
VLFYYSFVTVPAGNFTITVNQSANPAFTLLGVQQDQAILYNANCTKNQSVQTQIAPNGSTVTFTGNVASQTTFIIGIKYTPQTLTGKQKPGGNGEVTYGFSSSVNGNQVLTSVDSILLKKKPNKP